MADRPPFARVHAGLVAVAATAILLISANGYGYHRDELYFRMLRPGWGYADQPPFTPLADHLSIAVLGDHLWSVRVLAAFLLGGVALLLAAIAREAGGGPGAQMLAAAGAFGIVPLAAAHVNATSLPDLLVWLGVLFFALRVLLHGRERAWLGAGVVTGLGLYNKLLIVLLLACLGIALLIAGPRAALRSRWLWLGVAAAVVIGLPNLIYQVVEGFPQARMAGAIAQDKGPDARVTLLPFQLILIGPPLVPVWIAGLVRAWRDRRTRAFALAYPILLVAVFVTGGQFYYTGGLLLFVYAVGAVPAVSRAGRPWLIAAVLLNTAFSAVFALPVLPAAKLGFVAQLNSAQGDQIGWPEYAGQVAAVYGALPDADKPKAVLFTGNYGEAGALDRFGPRYGLPKAYSGHNELFAYGPPPDDRTVVIVVSEAAPAKVAARFGPCDRAATLHNRAGVDNEEAGAGVYVCRNLPAPWHSLWLSLRHFD